MLQVIGINKSYSNTPILIDVTFSVKQGEIISILGQSGVGKSTLLSVISTLQKPDSGKVLIDSIETNSLKNDNLAKFRNQNIGIVFQFHNLLPEFSALENVAMPAYISGLSQKDSNAKALEIMALLGISECKDRIPKHLSGGQAQRVAVARALINKPKIVFADEPSGSLDERTADDLHKLIFSLREHFDQTFVISTHNMKLADKTDRKMLLEKGKLSEIQN